MFPNLVRVLTVVACSLVFLGCDSGNARQRVSTTNFEPGMGRDAIVQRLQQYEATILDDTPGMLRAQYKTAEMPRPMRVELAFTNGKLTKVNFVPQ